jgi:predicted transcriptional regulator
MTTSGTKHITTEVPLTLAQRLDALAARLERPRDDLVCEALESWLRHEDQRDRLTQEAMEDVDAGRTVSHEAVLAWADSLQTEHR